MTLPSPLVVARTECLNDILCPGGRFLGESVLQAVAAELREIELIERDDLPFMWVLPFNGLYYCVVDIVDVIF